MKVKYFRLNIVFESSVTVLWALVYVPTAFQSEGLTSRGLKRTPCPVLFTNRSNS